MQGKNGREKQSCVYIADSDTWGSTVHGKSLLPQMLSWEWNTVLWRKYVNVCSEMTSYANAPHCYVTRSLLISSSCRPNLRIVFANCNICTNSFCAPVSRCMFSIVWDMFETAFTERTLLPSSFYLIITLHTVLKSRSYWVVLHVTCWREV